MYKEEVGDYRLVCIIFMTPTHSVFRLRAANVLLIGFRGLNAEICKNLVLAGVKSVTIMDDEVVSPVDLGAHLFLSEESIGKNVLY